MSHFYELTIMVRTEEPKSADTFNAVADGVARGLDGHVMHRVREVQQSECPVSLRDGEAGDGV